MIGIRAVASYVPAQRESNLARMAEFGINEDFVRQKLGVVERSRKAEMQETSDLCVAAFEAMRTREGMDAGDIDCLVVCTQNPDGHGLPHTSSVVHRKLDLSDSCAAFDISLGCSGFVYGLSIVKSFMEANAMRRGLLFTADPYSKIIDPEDKNTALLFGDAAAVTLLGDESAGSPQWYPRAFEFGTRGKEGAALQNATGRLEMNGRAVFSFSATEVPKQVTALLKRSRLTPGDVDLFLFHQGSRFIVDTLRKRLGLPPEKVPLMLEEFGNTVSSSIPMLLERYLRQPHLRRILISGFGVGLSWASALLERKLP
jgi:3-oxoacyl-[acyl-carrier-protein] synthase-3